MWKANSQESKHIHIEKLGGLQKCQICQYCGAYIHQWLQECRLHEDITSIVINEWGANPTWRQHLRHHHQWLGEYRTHGDITFSISMAITTNQKKINKW